MQSKTIKTGLSLLLGIVLALCAICTVFPVSAYAEAVVNFDMLQAVGSTVYATSYYCESSMKEIPNADSFCVVNGKVYFLSYWEEGEQYGAGLYVMDLSGNNKKMIANHASGDAAYYGGKIYYSGGGNAGGTKQGVYCLDVKTGKTKRVVANGTLLSVYDGSIYYTAYAKGEYVVYRCTLTGKSKTRYTDYDGISYGLVTGGKYFDKPDGHGAIYSLDAPDGTRYDRVCLADEYSGFWVQDGFVYYVRDNALFKCTTHAWDGSDEVKLCDLTPGARGAFPIKVVGGTLYFVEDYDKGSNNEFLYKVPINGGAKTFTGNSWFES